MDTCLRIEPLGLMGALAAVLSVPVLLGLAIWINTLS